jgi:hypothetical protein
MAILLFRFILAEGQEVQSFSFNNFTFFMSSKFLEDGSIMNTGLEYNYTEVLSGRVNFNYTNISKNEELLNVQDSLNAVNEKIFEVLLSPIGYYFYKTDEGNLWIGGGVYYENDTLNEKGFFNMPSLEYLNPPKERVNSYTNDFSMNIFGPLVEAEINYNARYFGIGFSSGIIPVFLLNAKQITSIVPLIYPNSMEHTQDTFGSPHFYLKLDGILKLDNILKLDIIPNLNFVLLYDFTRLEYDSIDFDNSLSWTTTGNTIIMQSLKSEVSVLIPAGGDMRLQTGFGYVFESMYLDSHNTVLSKPYLILSMKKI